MLLIKVLFINIYPTEIVPITFKFSPACVNSSASILSAKVHSIPSCPTTERKSSSLGIGLSLFQNVTSHLHTNQTSVNNKVI